MDKRKIMARAILAVYNDRELHLIKSDQFLHQNYIISCYPDLQGRYNQCVYKESCVTGQIDILRNTIFENKKDLLMDILYLIRARNYELKYPHYFTGDKVNFSWIIWLKKNWSTYGCLE